MKSINMNLLNKIKKQKRTILLDLSSNKKVLKKSSSNKKLKKSWLRNSALNFKKYNFIIKLNNGIFINLNIGDKKNLEKLYNISLTPFILLYRFGLISYKQYSETKHVILHAYDNSLKKKKNN